LGGVNSVAFSPDGVRIASGSSDRDAASGNWFAQLSTWDGKGLVYAPDGLFAGDADPRAAFAIVRGLEVLPIDDFVALNRRESLALKETAAAK
jgi:hypothetical protein